MRHVLGVLVAGSLLAVLAGCAGHCTHCQQSPEQAQVTEQAPSEQTPMVVCPQHGPHCPLGIRCPCLAHGGQAGPAAPGPGPFVGQVTYPYYTVRGPRDFLQRTPSPTGP